MFHVFGRPTSDNHPYRQAITKWIESEVQLNHAMARNLMYDHRVSMVREQAFHEFGREPTTPSDLMEAINYYVDKRIRFTKNPDYLDEDLNAENFLSPTVSGHCLVNRDVRLVRVVDINGLAPVYQWAKDNRFRRFDEFPQQPKDIDKWLDENLEGRSDDDTYEFIEATLLVMNHHRKVSAFQPTWVTTWDALTPHIPGGPERWLESLGMHKSSLSRWLILLSYTVREAGRLVRPTQLDAGWFPYHFPSPPDAYGHPMDLRISPLADMTIPEFIHEQIDHSIDHWTNADRLCKKTGRLNTDEISFQRRAHHRLLATIYGRDLVSLWMPSCSNGCPESCK